MPNNYLSVLYKHIIQVEKLKWGVKSVCVCVGRGGGAQTYYCPQSKTCVCMWGGGVHALLAPPPRFLRQ